MRCLTLKTVFLHRSHPPAAAESARVGADNSAGVAVETVELVAAVRTGVAGVGVAAGVHRSRTLCSCRESSCVFSARALVVFAAQK